MLAGMLPARLLRRQERGPVPPAPPVGGKTLVLSHQHISHACVARDLREMLASASPRGLDMARDLRSTALMAEVPMQRGPCHA